MASQAAWHLLAGRLLAAVVPAAFLAAVVPAFLVTAEMVAPPPPAHLVQVAAAHLQMERLEGREVTALEAMEEGQTAVFPSWHPQPLHTR